MSWTTRWQSSIRRDAASFLRLALCWGLLHLLVLSSYSTEFITNLSGTDGCIHFRPQVRDQKAASPSNEQRLMVEQRAKPPETSLTLKHSGSTTAKEAALASFTAPRFETTTRGAPTCAKIAPQEIAFTLVTQLSDDRLWMIGHHCAGWKSNISLAILTDRSEESIKHELVERGCNNNVEVRVLSQRKYQSADYPVNVLRNLAISAVNTSHFFYVDADFWLSHHTDDILKKKDVRECLSSDPKLTIVIPAYQLRYRCPKHDHDPTRCRSDKVSQMPRTKLKLLEGMRGGNVTVFDPKNPHGHGSTMYDLWMAQRSGNIQEIRCLRSERYEPYLVVQHCRDLPPCQENFTGYGKNKISWIMHLRRAGYKFAQLGGSFLVHYPHAESDSKKLWAKKKGAKRAAVDSIFHNFTSWLDSLPNEERVSICPTLSADVDSSKQDGDDDKSLALPEFKRVTQGVPTCQRIDPQAISYTLVTQLSDNRLWMMKHHCAGWNSPISLAVFTNHTKEAVERNLTDMGCRNFALKVVSDVNFAASEYPVNVLRNLAISGVRTSHFLYIDADFWLSRRTDDVLKKDDVRTVLSKDPKQAIVLPAYQMECKCSAKDLAGCREEKSALVPRTKLSLLDGVNRGTVFMFDPKNPRGHGSTDYDLWMAQRAGSVTQIPCLKSDRYEPYLVVQHCRELPPCQEQFTGYGKNKISWIMQVRRAGYKFAQVGGSFLVHYPHAESNAKKLWAKKSRAKRDAVDGLFSNFSKWLLTLPDEQRLSLCPNADDIAGSVMEEIHQAQESSRR